MLRGGRNRKSLKPQDQSAPKDQPRKGAHGNGLPPTGHPPDPQTHDPQAHDRQTHPLDDGTPGANPDSGHGAAMEPGQRPQDRADAPIVPPEKGRPPEKSGLGNRLVRPGPVTGRKSGGPSGGAPGPVIGLALGGGVARGWAHIGVIRALERAGIRPDVVCGTSIGALVGGCYLAGHLDTLEEWARGLTKRRLLSYLDIMVSGSGILGGRKLAKMMDTYLSDVRVEDLERTFVAVTGELATGHEVWIDEGPMVEAIQASYALPGVFTPTMREGRWLIDGALVNPVPVSVCRAKGARLVIAVTLNADAFGKHTLNETDLNVDLDLLTEDGENTETSTPPGGPAGRSRGRPKAPDAQRMMMRQLFGREQSAPGMGTVMLGALNIVMDRLARSRMAGDPPDVLVCPKVAHVSLLAFDRAADLIQLGEDAVAEQLPAIKSAMAVLR